MAKKKTRKSERSYARLTKAERKSIERMLDQNKSCRAIAEELGRSPSTISDEVARHRYVTSPRAHYGESAPESIADACPGLAEWPCCCNGCRRHKIHGCKKRLHVLYLAKHAQRAADAELSESRRGIDEDEQSASCKLSVIKNAIARGLSPAQISALYADKLDISRSTIYRWVEAGYGGMTNLELRRKVGYKKRSHTAPRKSAKHSDRRSHDAFLALDENVRDAAWELDTVEGRAEDSVCLLTLFHRPTAFQLVLPLAEQTSEEVIGALRLVSSALGSQDAIRRVFGVVLTDNGHEFADEGAISSVFDEQPGETKLFFCDPRRADQKGACEKNHVEIRKLLPKGRGLKFDLLTRGDCALIMSQINSEPRGKLAWMSPIHAFVAALGEDARALIEAFGICQLSPDELDLTLGCIERDRASKGLPSLLS